MSSENESLPDTPERVDVEGIRARCEAATKGPWSAKDVAGAGLQISGVLPEGFKFDGTAKGADGRTEFMLWTIRQLMWVQIADERWVQFETGPWADMQKANADFIAHARTDIPALLALIEHQARELIEVREVAQAAVKLVRAKTIEECAAVVLSKLDLYPKDNTAESMVRGALRSRAGAIRALAPAATEARE